MTVKRWAHVVAGQISNVVLQEAKPTGPDLWVEVQGAFGPGDLYDGQAFQRAQPVAVRRITPGAFRDRFTAAEAARIDLASADVPSAPAQQRLQAAELRARMRRLDGAEYVDLDDELRTRAPVQALEDAGLLDATGRAVQILDAPVLDAERPGV